MSIDAINLESKNLQSPNRLTFDPLFPNEKELRSTSANKVAGVVVSKEDLSMCNTIDTQQLPEEEAYLVAAIVLPGTDIGYTVALTENPSDDLNKLVYRQITTRLVLGGVVGGTRTYIRFLSFVISKYSGDITALDRIISSVVRGHRDFTESQALDWRHQLEADIRVLIPENYREATTLLRGGSQSFGRLTESILLINRAIQSEKPINLIDILEISQYPLDLDALRIALHAFLLKETLSENEKQLVASWLSDMAILDGYNSQNNRVSFVRPFQKGINQLNGDRFERSIPTFEGMKVAINAYRLYYSKLPNWLEINGKTGRYNFTSTDANKLKADLNLMVAHLSELFKLELIKLGTSLRGTTSIQKSSLDMLHEHSLNYNDMVKAVFDFLKDNATSINDYPMYKEWYIKIYTNIKELERLFNELREDLFMILDYLEKPEIISRPNVLDEYTGPRQQAYYQRIINAGGKLPRMHYALPPNEKEG